VVSQFSTASLSGVLHSARHQGNKRRTLSVRRRNCRANCSSRSWISALSHQSPYPSLLSCPTSRDPTLLSQLLPRSVDYHEGGWDHWTMERCERSFLEDRDSASMCLRSQYLVFMSTFPLAQEHLSSVTYGLCANDLDVRVHQYNFPLTTTRKAF
jgi:hypothetical protein